MRSKDCFSTLLRQGRFTLGEQKILFLSFISSTTITLLWTNLRKVCWLILITFKFMRSKLFLNFKFTYANGCWLMNFLFRLRSKKYIVSQFSEGVNLRGKKICSHLLFLVSYEGLSWGLVFEFHSYLLRRRRDRVEWQYSDFNYPLAGKFWFNYLGNSSFSNLEWQRNWRSSVAPFFDDSTWLAETSF